MEGDHKAFVLLIDDETMIRDVGRAVLENLGYRVVTASGGQDGIDLFARLSQSIDLVILDLSMPDMDGETTYAALRRIKPGAKVILASGYCLDAKAQKMLRKGNCYFLQKPFKIGALDKAIRLILDVE